MRHLLGVRAAWNGACPYCLLTCASLPKVDANDEIWLCPVVHCARFLPTTTESSSNRSVHWKG